MRSILIVGAGQAGLQLAHGLLAEGYQVTIMSARTPQDIRGGAPTSTQSMFEQALATERIHGLNLWEQHTPPITGFRMLLPSPTGPLDIIAELDQPGRSVDQRLKMATWLELAEQRGATIVYQPATRQDLDTITASDLFDLVVVAAGRGDLVAAFDPDPARCVFDTPQRSMAAAYVHGFDPDPQWPAPHIAFHPVPAIGEMFVIPALTLSGPCDILLWEAVPGGPADRWTASRITPATILDMIVELADRFIPSVADRARNVTLTDAHAALHGRFTPQVRRPVAYLPAGGVALGIGDVLVTNDPISGQGANTAAKAAAAYLKAILERGDQPFDEYWMTAVFEDFWRATAGLITDWTNTLLQPPPPRVQQIYAAAAADPALARRLANGFANPHQLADWFMNPPKSLASAGPAPN